MALVSSMRPDLHFGCFHPCALNVMTSVRQRKLVTMECVCVCVRTAQAREQLLFALYFAQ